MDNKNKVLIIGVVFLSMFLLYLSVNASNKSGTSVVLEPSEKETITSILEHSEDSFKKAQEAESIEDPCTAPEGYTEESWREHMGHHPANYKDCL
jgi:hypothetical protein